MEMNDEVLFSNVVARRKGKDSVFLNLFHIPQYTVELVKALHPNLTISEGEVKTVSLQSILLAKPYNDLGILVKGKLLIFAEKLKPAGNTSCSIAFTKSSVEYWSRSLKGGIKVT